MVQAEIEQAKRTGELDLSGRGLVELPAEISQLTNLHTLYLSGNGLGVLPEWFGNLTNLQTLTLDGNGLGVLPESFGNLTNLHTLLLYGNGLGVLPESFGNLTNLHELYLDGNGLGVLPESFGNLTNLHTLLLGGNGLGVLPESLGNLTNLQTLTLDGNGLEALPKSFANLTNLHTLDLYGNPLEPALQAAYEQGIEAVLSHVRSNNKEVAPTATDEHKAASVSELATPQRHRPSAEETADLARSLERLLGEAITKLHAGQWDDSEPGVKAQVEHDIANLRVALQPLDFTAPKAESVSAASSAVIAHLAALVAEETPTPLSNAIIADGEMTGAADTDQALAGAEGLAQAIELPEEEPPDWYDTAAHDQLDAILDGELPPQEDWPSVREAILNSRAELVTSLLGWGPQLDRHLPSATLSALSTTTGLTSLLLKLVGFPLVDATVIGVVVASVAIKLRAMFRNRGHVPMSDDPTQGDDSSIA